MTLHQNSLLFVAGESREQIKSESVGFCYYKHYDQNSRTIR